MFGNAAKFSQEKNVKTIWEWRSLYCCARDTKGTCGNLEFFHDVYSGNFSAYFSSYVQHLNDLSSLKEYNNIKSCVCRDQSTRRRLRGAGGFENITSRSPSIGQSFSHSCIRHQKQTKIVMNTEYIVKSSVISPGLIHHAKRNMIFAVTFLFLVIVLEVKGDCLTGRCEKISLDVHQDAVQDSEFVGHVFHNSVTLNPIQCYMKCIQDCRCLSVNYKENNDQRYCELNEGNHFTNKSSFKQSPGSHYYILRRDYSLEVM